MAASTAPAEDVGAARAVLRELCAAGADAALVVELAAEDGRVAPRLFAHEPGGLAPPALELTAFTAFAAAPGWHSADASTAQWLREGGAAGSLMIKL
jgi:hypothetical protein